FDHRRNVRVPAVMPLARLLAQPLGAVDADAFRHREACAVRTSATQAVSFLAYSMCRNSFGPCALECGPSTPVMRNCAFGNFSPSMAMHGMVPPMPTHIMPLP